MEKWPSGLRRSPGKRVHGNVSGVRIPSSPPYPLLLKALLSYSNITNVSFCNKTFCKLAKLSEWISLLVIHAL